MTNLRIEVRLSVRLLVLFSLVVVIVLGANGQEVPRTSVAEYRILADDVLELYVVDIPEISRQLRVDSGGWVEVPLIPERLQAVGLTLPGFAKEVESQLQRRELVTKPHVTVRVLSSRLSVVSITGAVHKPQLYPIFGATTVLDVLSQAEGLEPDAGDDILIQRSLLNSNGMTDRVNVTSLLSGDTSSNLPVYPGDRLAVPRGGIVYVVGAVNKPGGFQLGLNRQHISLLQAIALAEDLKATAKRKESVLIRKAATGRQEIRIDLKKVLQGDSADMPLQADDILFVPDSTSRKLLRRGTEAVLQVATGVAIYGRY